MEVIDDDTLDKLEKRIDEVRMAYEQYFLGSRKRAPEQQKTSVQFLVRRLANQYTPNTKLRFRFQQLTAKFNSYNQYWNRTMQQIESGTYHRDRFKAQLRSKTIDPKPAPKTADKPAPGSNIDKLYDDLVSAREQCKQSTQGLSKEKLEATINKQLPKLQEKYKGKKVEFKVVVEGGQAKLKATTH